MNVPFEIGESHKAQQSVLLNSAWRYSRELRVQEDSCQASRRWTSGQRDANGS